FLLLGFMGIALDLGHLFVVKTELQTAMDSCALAAAQELDVASTALTRARNAGTTAGNLNRVNFQSADWSGKGTVTAADITFRDANFNVTTDPAAAKYAQCAHTQSGVQMWLLHLMSFAANAGATYSSTQDLSATASATRVNAQTACPIPVALIPKAGGTAPNFGFQVGEWVTVFGTRLPKSGELGWYNLDGTTRASSTRDELAEGGSCGTRIGDTLTTPGVQTTVDIEWNRRFGIYKNNDDPSQHHPDFSGYAYTSTNWKNAVPQNAFSGTPAAGSDPTAANFQTKRVAFASYDDTGSDIQDGSRIVFGSKNQLNSFKSVATPGTGGQHQQYGYNRRVVTIPVLDGSSKVMSFACMFMLDPLSGPQGDAHMEFLGNAGSLSSPCTTNGLPGGSAGPLVPVLVR
ncbi:MAG: pilus assembly protein TadG-related protein, partial [Burkholderiaceae bacterium]